MLLLLLPLRWKGPRCLLSPRMQTPGDKLESLGSMCGFKEQSHLLPARVDLGMPLNQFSHLESKGDNDIYIVRVW